MDFLNLTFMERFQWIGFANNHALVQVLEWSDDPQEINQAFTIIRPADQDRIAFQAGDTA